MSANFSDRNKVTIMNTILSKKKRRWIDFEKPKKRIKNVIDFIIADKANVVKDQIVINNDNIGSAHGS